MPGAGVSVGFVVPVVEVLPVSLEPPPQRHLPVCSFVPEVFAGTGAWVGTDPCPDGLAMVVAARSSVVQRSSEIGEHHQLALPLSFRVAVHSSRAEEVVPVARLVEIVREIGTALAFRRA